MSREGTAKAAPRKRRESAAKARRKCAAIGGSRKRFATAVLEWVSRERPGEGSIDPMDALYRFGDGSDVGGSRELGWAAVIKKVLVGESDDEVTVRIVFSSYVEEEQSLLLKLTRDWKRLAPALSLTEEEISR
eukprot:jgi/Undpi1/10237/HiC_scaffold_28.g12690.m1